MNVNEKIAQRREQLGLSEQEVAEKIDVNIYWYGDIERIKYEVMRTIELSKFKLLCQILELKPLELLGISELSNTEIYSLAPRNILINRRRIELGLSEDSLGDQVGFYGYVIHAMEEDEEYLESWCLEDILTLANILKLPAQALLKIG